MIIKDIKMINFGKFHNKEMSFEKGMNIIYGENEAGKTTIHTFIRGMLFGIEKQRGRAADRDTYTKYQPWDNPSNYCGMMRIEENGVTYRIERNFNKDNKSCTIVREDLGTELNDKEISELFSGFNENCYYNTISISQLGGATDRELEVILGNYAANLGSTKSTELDMKAALMNLKDSKKRITIQNKLDRKEEIIKEKDNIVQELDISEQEQMNILENIDKDSAQLEALVLKRDELNKLEESQKDLIIAGEVKKETLSNKKDKLEKEVQSARSSKMELEYNAEGLGRYIEEGRESSLEEVETSIKKVKKKSKLSVLSFIVMILSGAAALAMYMFGTYSFGGDIFKSELIMLYRTEIIYTLLGIAVFMAVVWIISMIMRGSYRKNELLRLESVKENCETIKKLEQEIKTQEDGIGEKNRQLDDTIAALRDVEYQMSQIPKYKEEIIKLDEMINSLNMKISKAQWELEQSKSSDAKLYRRLEELEASIEGMQTAGAEVQAIETAIEYIEEIGSEVRNSFGRNLNKKASQYIKEITGGKYDNIVINDKLNIKINSKDKLINFQRMSKGTVEQIYMALRLAAADILFENDKKPILMDDAFAMYDNKRMANTMAYMNSNLEQVIIFSCHTREKVMADKLNLNYNLIII